MPVSSDSLNQHRQRRDALVEAIHRLDRAWMAPWCGRTSPWHQELLDRLEEVVRLLDEHAQQIQSGQGLLAQIGEEEPRFLDKVNQLSQEHSRLLNQAQQLLEELRAKCAKETSDSGEEGHSQFTSEQELRDKVSQFLHELRHHHARENDLIYEALHTDLGSVD